MRRFFRGSALRQKLFFYGACTLLLRPKTRSWPRCNKSATLWKKVKTKRRRAIKLGQIDFTFVESFTLQPPLIISHLLILMIGPPWISLLLVVNLPNTSPHTLLSCNKSVFVRIEITMRRNLFILYWWVALFRQESLCGRRFSKTDS